MTKRIFSLILLPLVILSVFSCGRDNVFTHAEFSLPLPKDFYEVEAENSDLLMTNGEVTVAVSRYSFESEGIPAYLSADIFAEYCLEKSGIDADIYMYGDIPYFTYYDSSSGARLYCMVTYYSTPYAYFSVLYATRAANEAAWREKFLAIADGAYYNQI
jgi:hypothetical protein